MNFVMDFHMMTQYSLFAITCIRDFPMTAYTIGIPHTLLLYNGNSPYSTEHDCDIIYKNGTVAICATL